MSISCTPLVREVGAMTAPSLGRVLIVDDEVELMTALCESLTDQGYEALGRTSAQEALALLQGEDSDAFEWYRVDKAVGNVRNQGPGLIDVLKE